MGVSVISSCNEVFVTAFDNTRTVDTVGVHTRTLIYKTVSSRSKRKLRDTKTFLLAFSDSSAQRNCGASVSGSNCPSAQIKNRI